MINICVMAKWEPGLRLIVDNLESSRDALKKEYGMDMNIIEVYSREFSIEDIMPTLVDNDVHILLFDNHDLDWSEHREYYTAWNILDDIVENKDFVNPYILRAAPKMRTYWEEDFSKKFASKEVCKIHYESGLYPSLTGFIIATWIADGFHAYNNPKNEEVKIKLPQKKSFNFFSFFKK